jgi:hypothetical protein
LPTIKHKVKSHLDTIHQKLVSLPELLDNVECEVKTGLLNCADKAWSCLESFSRKFTVLLNNFRDCLIGMKPKIGFKDDSDLSVMELLCDDELEVNVATGGSKRHPMKPQTPRKRQRVGAAGHEDMSPQIIRKELFHEPFQEFSRIGSGFRILR